MIKTIKLTPDVHSKPCGLYRTTSSTVVSKDLKATVTRFKQLGYNEIDARRFKRGGKSYYWIFARMIPCEKRS